MTIVPYSDVSEKTGDFFFSSKEQDKPFGCIGHLRGDFDTNGNSFYTTFFDHSYSYSPEEFASLKTPAFARDFNLTVNFLRNKGQVLQNRDSMKKYCLSHPNAQLSEKLRADSYGFIITTDDYIYCLRAFYGTGDYNFYIYCYVKSLFEQFLQ